MADNICTCTTPQYTVILNTQGPPGKQGTPGVDGFSPVITVNTDTETTYTLNILTEDGMITTPNLKSSLPSGGTNGQVLTNTGNGNYTWNDIPQSTPQGQGIIRISTDADFVPDDEGNLDDTTAVTPQRLKDYTSEFLKANNIIAGENISLSVADNNITISSTGGGTPTAIDGGNAQGDN